MMQQTSVQIHPSKDGSGIYECDEQLLSTFPPLFSFFINLH